MLSTSTFHIGRSVCKKPGNEAKVY